MRLTTFIKRLQALEAAGHGRAKMVVDKDTLWDGNGVFNICDVHSVGNDWINEADGDGGLIENRDGTERGRTCIVISGPRTIKGALP
jgi:hypothetical protein